MKKNIIIGAGLSGLSAAYHLAKAGFSVTIMEKNESVGGKGNLIEAGEYKLMQGVENIKVKKPKWKKFYFSGSLTISG